MIPPPELPVRGKYAKLFEHINRLRNYCVSLAPVQSKGVKTGHFPRGVSRVTTPGESTTTTQAGTVKRFRVLGVRTDYALECVEEASDGTIPTTLTNVRRTYVAMPASYRPAAYNNIRVGDVLYGVSGSSDTRNGVITDVIANADIAFQEKWLPEYQAHSTNTDVPPLSRIYAAAVDTSTDLSITASYYPGVTSEELIQLNYIDLNVDARRWTPIPFITNFCVSGAEVPGIVFGKVP